MVGDSSGDHTDISFYMALRIFHDTELQIEVNCLQLYAKLDCYNIGHGFVSHQLRKTEKRVKLLLPRGQAESAFNGPRILFVLKKLIINDRDRRWERRCRTWATCLSREKLLDSRCNLQCCEILAIEQWVLNFLCFLNKTLT
jgi:hypothetical protein